MRIPGVSGPLSSAGAAGSWRERIRDSQIGLGGVRTAIAEKGRGLGPILSKGSQHVVAEMSPRCRDEMAHDDENERKMELTYLLKVKGGVVDRGPRRGIWSPVLCSAG